MFDINSITRENVKRLKPYSSARDDFQGNASIWLDANENPNDNGLNRYPDPHQKLLKQEIARLKNVQPQQIFLGNGSDEAIDLLFRAFGEPKEDKVLLFPPTYGMYKVSAEVNDIEVLEVPLNDRFQIDTQKVKPLLEDNRLKLIFICSPNNPTGNLMNKENIKQIASKFHGLVVVDEAYIDFSPEGSILPELDTFPNLVVLQTFSKAWGMAGVRLGMAYANKPIIDVLNKIKPPYNVNELTQRTVLDHLKNLAAKNESVEEILVQKELLNTELSKLKNVVKIYPSEANFLLVQFSNPKEVYQQLAEKGIVVRDRTSAVKDCLRITIGIPAENEQLLIALAEISGDQLEFKPKENTRNASVNRHTSETNITVEINLDGTGKSQISTGIGFFDHMLEQLARHGNLDLKINVTGDLHIDEHHTIEDTALALGEAFNIALGKRRGIERYGFLLPMDDCLAQVAIDFGGRPWLVWEAEFKREKVGEMPTEMFMHFFKSFSDTARCNLNIKAEGKNEHHKIEAIFKAWAKSVKMAVSCSGHGSVPSTKGVL